MTFSDTSYNLRIELDTKNCELSAGEIAKMERGLDPLRKPLEKFPVCDLYITITHHPRSEQYRVKMALVLTGRTLMTGDVDDHIYPAYERGVRKLLHNLGAYIGSMEAEPEQRKFVKGTHQEVMPEYQPDGEAIAEAIESGDYAAFRQATSMYEESVRKRVGRWIQQYPEVENRIGQQLKIEDLVEEVFLNAFERYPGRPDEIRLGEWLEQLIAPSVKLLIDHPAEEMESISFAQSYQESRTDD